MWEEQSMGSQTLEILRQGVWASITGGWFYDPSQDVFCNTFHLYIWLFLLCLPFTIYVYFPPVEYMWYVYCASVTIVIGIIKSANYFLHYVYDTKECIHEDIEDTSQDDKRDDEGIELQDLSRMKFIRVGNSGVVTRPVLLRTESSSTKEGYNLPYEIELQAVPSKKHSESLLLRDNFSDFVEYVETQQLDVNGEEKPSSTIDLKADVHRKRSTESSDTDIEVTEVVAHEPSTSKEKRLKNSEKKVKHQRSKTDGFVTVTIKDEKDVLSSKLYPQASTSTDLQDPENGLLIHNRPSLHSAGSEQSNLRKAVGRRHSNFTNSSLTFIPLSIQANIKPTGSLELGYIDKNPNQALTSEGFYFKPSSRGGVRRIRSTALETCCPPPPLQAHPNSLEVIGCKSTRNPLPPPSTSLTRNQHLNLCPYYGSEIVYPIAEQSDEHQTSHGPDTDLDSLTHVSDSDYEEHNQGSHSPLLYMKKHKHVPYVEKHEPKVVDEERTSATSKDALLDPDNSNSSATPEIHDVRTDSFATDNEISDKKLSEGSNLSCSSVEFDERTDLKMKPFNTRPNWDNRDVPDFKMLSSDYKSCEINDKYQEDPQDLGIVRRKHLKKNKRRKRGSKARDGNNCSSLVELDLDWLFDDENHMLQHRKEPLKRETEWSSTTTVSLEHDVSKVLQEPVPSMRSLGAIPKKMRSCHTNESERKTPKSESEKCKSCRCKSGSASQEKSITVQEKVTQTSRIHEDSSPDGPDCLVKLSKATVSKKGSLNSQSTRHEEASSSGSNNELSTLLPPAPPLLSAFLNSRRDLPITVCVPAECIKTTNSPHSRPRGRLRRARASRKRSGHAVKRENAIACSLSAGYGTHGAKNFNDTSDGAVHCFMDEHGNYITYTFDEKGKGTSSNVGEEGASGKPQSLQQTESATSRTTKTSELWDSNSGDSACSGSLATVLDTRKTAACPVSAASTSSSGWSRPTTYTGPRALRYRDHRRRLMTQQNINIMLEDLLNNDPADQDFIKIDSEVPLPKNYFKCIRGSNTEKVLRTKSYYKLKLLPWTFVKVTLDRLKLLALLDRNLTVKETILSIVLGSLVSILGATLLFLNFYKDLLAFVFCFIIASCQYSLLKSVQPDAASPTHGFNRIIAYSRPIYFSLFSTVILILHFNIENGNQYYLITSRDFFVTFILFFPLLFSLGLFPQFNTFVLYFLEQIDIHLFGGNAICSLVSSFYCILRSVLSVIILIGFAYGGLNEEKSSQHMLFSIFCSCLVAICYHLSRSASDPTNVWNLIKKHLWLPDMYRESDSASDSEKDNSTEETMDKLDDKTNIKEKTVKFSTESKENNPREEHVDPLPQKLQDTVNARLKNDVIICSLIAVLVFAVHGSTVFTVLQPELSPVLWSMAATLGFILHYIVPQLRKQLPWMCIARPVLRSHEHGLYQIRGPAKIMWFERVYVYFCFFERNILYPLLFLSVLTEDAPKIAQKYGTFLGSLITVVCGLKSLRNSYSDQSVQYLIVVFTALFFKYDYSFLKETFLVEFFFMSIIYQKCFELLLKIQFVITYIAPWQITWGSAFHAFAQPFSVPHSAMLFVQTIVSAAISSPLNPFLGSAIFFTSYVRPVKFWERDYNTRRVDHSNTPLSSHLDRNLGADDNNLNSIFYEHLTRSLQHSLCGDLALGRWGPVNQGDIFVMASDYLNCLVHIIEMGNGLISFQMRGLEFRGTYCQQREVEAITEGVEENDDCCCCDTGHLPNMLSINAAFSQRWLAWEVTAAKYILEGYSISDNSVVSMLQVFEFRKVLVSYYVKSIIFYTIRSPKLEEWLSSPVIQKALQPMQQRNFVDLDPVFNYNIDEDYDFQHSGMTISMFNRIHGDWVNFCLEKSEKNIDASRRTTVMFLCFALSLLGRRTLGAVSHNTVSSVEFFLYGLHALFKGDFRITCARDEWVFTDMDLLKTVVAPGVRMSLKLHQDHFMSPDEYEELPALYEAICKHEEELVISHEGDPAWRSAVLSGTPSLLALRHVFDEGNDEYKIIMLNKSYLSFRIIKINKECVRGLWAGQQQELVYLRNRNPERGSIQNAKQALRNIINSSCDQPIGYPIYVSPLTTSYAETNEHYKLLIGGSISLKKIQNFVFNLFRRIRKRCGEGCSSGASNREEIGMGHEGVYAMTPMTFPTTGSQSMDGSHLGGSIGRGSSLSRVSLGGNRGSLVSVGKPTSSTLASLAGLFKERDERAVSQTPDAQIRTDERLGDRSDSTEKEYVASRVKIIDPNLVFDCINLGRRIDVSWPTEYMRCRGGRSHWKDWVPEAGMEGPVVHKWTPCHKDTNKRSHVDRTILLVQIDDKFVPIAESGVQDLGPEV